MHALVDWRLFWERVCAAYVLHVSERAKNAQAEQLVLLLTLC